LREPQPHVFARRATRCTARICFGDNLNGADGSGRGPTSVDPTDLPGEPCVHHIYRDPSSLARPGTRGAAGPAATATLNCCRAVPLTPSFPRRVGGVFTSSARSLVFERGSGLDRKNGSSPLCHRHWTLVGAAASRSRPLVDRGRISRGRATHEIGDA